jgi:hypothetical protein
MGDYDQRLISYCHGFVEKFGEEKLMKLGAAIDKDKLCVVRKKT